MVDIMTAGRNLLHALLRPRKTPGWTLQADRLNSGMPKYRIYLSEGRQIDIDAEQHMAYANDKSPLSRVDFLDGNGKVVASFSAAALHGYTKIENLSNQKNRGED